MKTFVGTMRTFVCTIIALLALSLTASAQKFLSNAAFSGGWVHVTGNQGVNGFDIGGEVIVTPPVSLAFDYDAAWGTSTLGTFETTSVGLTSVHNRLQDVLVGPRIYFPHIFKNKAKDNGPCGSKLGFLNSFEPFLEAQFGVSNINTKVESVGTASISSSATDFTWMLGGGGDIRLNPHWAFRAKGDLLRTHFADAGQSHFRFVAGVVYTIKPRTKW